MARAFSEIAFTPDVLAAQEAMGSREAYAEFLAPDTPPGNRIGPEERAFIEARDGFYQATVSETGWPYVQFRGGPAGFLRVIDGETIGYADYRGNRQYLSLGNLKGNDRVALILMDYPNQRRLKILGRVRHVDVKEDPVLVARLHAPGGRGRPERAALITVEGLDWNCPQHIPQRMTLDEMAPLFREFRGRISTLEAENAALRARLGEAAAPADGEGAR